jgi:acyl-CoA reductase-like NAD-dependent aldehyde dehydrogenase
MRDFHLYINGKLTPSSDGRKFQTKDKANGEVIGEVYLPSNQDITTACEAAHQAFYHSEWKDWTKEQRGEVLVKIAEGIKARSKELVEWEIKDSGSTVRKAKGDIHNAAGFFKHMARELQQFEFEAQDEKASREGFSKNSRFYRPVGVCAQIIPWNFPLVMAAWKLAPAIAAGCTTVLKTAQETPVTACLLAEIIHEAGLPAGVVNIITGGASEGDYLLSNKRVRKIAFTGSTGVGRKIMAKAAEQIKNVSLELGGKSANIVLKDADLDIAVDGALYAFLYHSGQACDSGTRLLVDESIYPAFKERFLKRMKEIPVGNPADPKTGMGPVINDKQCKTIENYIQKSIEEGATLLAGGKRLTGGIFDVGYYIQPTAFEVRPEHTIFQEEIFGPVVAITTFKNEEEAIELANNSIYGLAGAVWSKDHERAKALAKKIETGTMWINEYHLLNNGMPFGGFKQSGIGREMGSEGLKAYLEVMHLWESDCDDRSKKMWFDAIF